MRSSTLARSKASASQDGNGGGTDDDFLVRSLRLLPDFDEEWRLRGTIGATGGVGTAFIGGKSISSSGGGGGGMGSLCVRDKGFDANTTCSSSLRIVEPGRFGVLGGGGTIAMGVIPFCKGVLCSWYIETKQSRTRTHSMAKSFVGAKNE
mmetsp:Transcript_16104/g.25229  ORF Transcript_16104/g.25229 Transcript_16104/m.25229 type:complete len:150 (-) Transcript_16104:111-560(-)